MIDVLNLALPYFSLIFLGFACGNAKDLPEAGLAWNVRARRHAYQRDVAFADRAAGVSLKA